jgi:peptidyl-prolyl cis-trans isomerase D
MFDLFRNHTKILMGILVLLIIPSFVFFGIDGYQRNAEQNKAVAVVDGRKITQMDWDQANEQTARRVRDQNPDMDMSLLDSPEVKYATLEQLVRDRVMLAAAQDSHLVINNAQLAAYLNADPTIASLRGADGKLDMQAYTQALARQGMTPESFEAGMRRDLSSKQVLLGVLGSGFASPALAGVSINALRQSRNIQYFLLKSDEYAAKVDANEAALQAYYKSNEAAFKRPESANIEYVELTVDALKSSITVAEADLRSYYDANKDSLGEAEQRRASHILIEAPKDMPADERAKLRAKADAIHAELLKNPAAFADVAKRDSQDPASAQQGGDLGFFAAKGASVVDDISKAAFALKAKGDISAVIDADFGFDIVQLTDLKPSQAPAFEVVRAKLEEQYRTEQAQKNFSASADEMGKIAFEQRDSLKPIADKFKLPIKTANGFANDRTQPAGVPAELGKGELVAAVFNADVTTNKGNTQPIPLAATRVVVARVSKHVPAHTQPFAEVAEQVRKMYVAQESAKLAHAAANAQLDTVRKTPASAPWLPAVNVSRDQAADVPAAVVEAALKADMQKLPAVQAVDLGAQGSAIVQVNKVVAAEALPPELQKQADQQYVMAWTKTEMDAYYNLLKDRFKVKINAPDPKKQGGLQKDKK